MSNLDINEAREVLDSIALDYNSESPSSKRESQKLIEQVHQIFLSKWSKYIPESVLELASLSIRNPIQTDHQGMKSELVPSKGLSMLVSRATLLSTQLDGDTEHLGDLSIIKLYPYKKGLDRFPKKKLDVLLNMVKDSFDNDLTKAKAYLDRFYFQTIHSHESAHACQGDSIPNWFAEIAARYYQIETMKTIYGENMLTTDEDSASNQFYKVLINKYGEDVHKYFFGNEIDSDTRRSIKVESFIFLTKFLARQAFTR